MKTILLKIGFAVFLTQICFILGGWLGSFSVDRSDGLVGGAIVFWYSIAGLVVGLLSGIVIPRYLSLKTLKIATIVVAVLGLSASAILAHRISIANQQAAGEEKNQPNTITQPR